MSAPTPRSAAGPAPADWDASEQVALIYRLKLRWVAAILIPASLLLYAYENRLSTWHRLPYDAFAGTLLTTGIVVVTFEYYVRRESETRLRVLVARVVREELPLLVERIAESLFRDPGILIATLSENSLHAFLRSGLATSFRDQRLASDVYDGLLKAIANYQERWANTECTAMFTPSADPELRDLYFETYLSYRFMTTLTRERFRVICTNSKEAYDSLLLSDLDAFYIYLLPPTAEFPDVGEDSFQVESFLVGGIELRKAAVVDHLRTAMVITCEGEHLKSLHNKRVTIEMVFRIQVRKLAHAIHLTTPRPSRGAIFEIDYGDSDIYHVDVFDTFTTRLRPDIRLRPTLSNPRRVEVHYDEWVFPKGGVVFVWHLGHERSESATGAA